MLTQFRSKRKYTGGLYHKIRKKKKRDIGSDFIPVKLGEIKVKKLRTYGGNKKIRLLQTNVANIIDKTNNKCFKSKIITVKENKANIHFVRMNIITKGAIIQTEAGLAKVVNRPGQEGFVNAILLEKK
ncbi:MAG: 30S ribosomal protein S8e [Candidatus Aenigmarchaeota archaeon]|nr:30S ribosomal protein S8e [Candidatus Aenigmarchaeota archaeon]